jgi:hypothetical protein
MSMSTASGAVSVMAASASPRGVAAAWLLPPHAEDPGEMRKARLRQGLLAGTVAGAACGLLLTSFFVVAVFMMIAGPLRGWRRARRRRGG